MTSPTSNLLSEDTTLDEILDKMADERCCIHGTGNPHNSKEKAKQALLQWRDKAVVGVELQARANAYYEIADTERDDLSAYQYWMEKRQFCLEEITRIKETPNED